MKLRLDFFAPIQNHPHPGPLMEGEGVTGGSYRSILSSTARFRGRGKRGCTNFVGTAY